MKKNLLLLPILVFVLIIVQSCTDDPGKKEEPGSTLVNIRYPDKGDFVLHFQQFLFKSNAKIVIDNLKIGGVVAAMVKQLNSIFKLPHNVNISFRYSDTANAWYQPATRSIDFTSAFILQFYQNFSKFYKDQQLIDKVTNVVIFFLFHELGHALTDIYQLSVRGPEEDMADYFSIYLLSTGGDVLKQAALDGADMFYEYSKRTENLAVSRLPLWDVHSLDKQRFYNICCLMYGSDPVKYAYFVNKRLVQPDTEGDCQYEYQRMITSWQKDLSFYMHTPAQ
jgi:Putative metallopeptidase